MVIVIVGQKGTKTKELAKIFEEKGYERLKRYTSRPPEKGEAFGEDFYFLSTEDFEYLIDCRYFAEVTVTIVDEDTGWYYGSAEHSYLTKGDKVVVLDPGGAALLKRDYDFPIKVVWLDTPAYVRKYNLAQEGVPEPEIRKIMNREEGEFVIFENKELFDIRIRKPLTPNEIFDYVTTVNFVEGL